MTTDFFWYLCPFSFAEGGRKWLRRTLYTAAGLAVVGGVMLPSNYIDGAVRFCRSAWAGIRITSEYKKADKACIGLSDAEITAVRRKSHENAAKILLELFKKQGGVYVKAGQHIASLYYLLPIEVCSSVSPCLI
jgi:hypothetical protein